jgi:hypothetical protein
LDVFARYDEIAGEDQFAASAHRVAMNRCDYVSELGVGSATGTRTTPGERTVWILKAARLYRPIFGRGVL